MSRLPSGLRWREDVLPDDPQKVADLVDATGFFNREERVIAVELVEERIARGPASGYDFLFAELEDVLAGYACFGRTPGTVSSYDLYWIVVSPRLQGSGVGSALLARLETTISREGGTQVWVDTSGRSQYEPTRSFYLGRGFHQEARLVDFYAPGDDKLILGKRLAVLS